MAVLNTLSFEDATDLINREFDAGKLNPINNEMKNSGFVVVNTISGNSGKTRRHKERPVGEQYASFKAEGDVSTKTLVQQGYYKDTTSKTYSKSIDITLEMRELDKTNVYDSVNFIANALPAKEDLFLAMFLSYGTATSYTDADGNTIDISTGDGLALYSTVHTLTGSATTFRSRIANNPAFSEGSLELAEDVLRTNTYNNLGEQVACKADTIITTDYPTLVNTVRRVIQSSAQISAPNSGVVNVYQGRYKHTILSRYDMSATGAKDSTKANYWGLLDSKISSFFHDIYIPSTMYSPTKGNNGEDIETLNWTYNSVGAWDSCIVSSRGMVFSTGDAA